MLSRRMSIDSTAVKTVHVSAVVVACVVVVVGVVVVVVVVVVVEIVVVGAKAKRKIHIKCLKISTYNIYPQIITIYIYFVYSHATYVV